MPVDLHALVDALALSLHIRPEVYAAHILHQNVQPGIFPGGKLQIQLPLLQQFPVVQCHCRLIVQQDIRPVICPPEPYLSQILLCVQSGAVQDIAIVLAQLLH